MRCLHCNNQWILWSRRICTNTIFGLICTKIA